jgi:hypothetical protein
MGTAAAGSWKCPLPGASSRNLSRDTPLEHYPSRSVLPRGGFLCLEKLRKGRPTQSRWPWKALPKRSCDSRRPPARSETAVPPGL